MYTLHRATLAILAVACMLALPSGGALPAPGSVGSSWAFEGSASGDTTSTPLAGLESIHYHATVVAIESETNLSNNISEVSIFRAVQTVFFADYATPGGLLEVNVTAGDAEVLVAHENVTWSGTMTGHGKNVTALALLDSSVSIAENSTTSSVRAFAASGDAPSRSDSAYVSSALRAHYSLNLTPALGLVPVDPASGHQWRSTSNFSLVGSYQGGYRYFVQAGFNSSVALSGAGNPSGAISPSSGQISVLATTTGTTNLSGIGVYGVGVALTGSPFVLVDGVLVPSEVEPLNPGTKPWWQPPEIPGLESVVTDRLLLSMPGTGNPSLLGSDERYTASMELPSVTRLGIATTVPVNSSEIVASPTSPTTATGDYNAIAASLTPSATFGGAGSSWLVWALVGLVAAAVVLGVVAGSRRRSRKGKETHSPHVRSGAGQETAAPASAKIPQDPLEHLW